MKNTFVKKVKLTDEDIFQIDEKFISEKIGLPKNKFEFIAMHFSDNFMFIEYKKVASPPSPSAFTTR